MINRLDKLSGHALAQAAEKNSGKKALIIVHPFFTRSSRLKAKNRKFEQFIMSKRINNYFVVVLEESHMIPALRKRLGTLGLTKSDSLFIVGTKGGMPDPVVGWQKLIAKLGCVGVRDLIVSGRDLDKHGIECVQHELEIEKKSIMRRKNRYSKIRAMRRAAQGNRTYAACAGITWSKLKSSGRFRVKASRHFT